MKISILNISSALLLLLVTSLSAAQRPAEEFRAMKKQYPDVPFVTLEMHKSLDIEMENNELSIDYSTSVKNFFLSENAFSYSSGSVSHSSFRVLENLEAYTLTPKKRRYKEEDVESFNTSDFGHSNVFYDDSKKTTFDFPGLSKGCMTYEKADFDITDPHMLPLFYIGSMVPIEKAVFSIRHDKNVEMNVTMLHMDSLDMDYQEKVEGSKIRKTWTIENLKKLEYESGAPALLHFTPQMIVRIASYTPPGESKVSVLNGVDDLHSWYCEFLKDTNEGDPDLKILADSITNGLEDEIEQVNAMYSWVKSNIKYIAFEDGYNGYIPQSATEVCHNRYGDCKGMSNLLYNMMRSQGIDAQLAWVGTRDLPYRYTQNPSPSVDNHMIAVLKSEGEYYFLDPTHSNLPFGLPSPFIQGKEVLVNQDCESYEIVKVPTIKSESNLVKDSVRVRIEGTTLHGNGQVEMTGFNRMNFIDQMNRMNSEELSGYCRNYLLKGSNRFVLDSMYFSNLDDTQKPLLLNYKFHIPNYVIAVGEEYYINLNLDKVSPPSKFSEERKLPYEIRYQSLHQEIVVLETIPEHEVTSLPGNTDFQHDQFDFSNTYTQHPGSIERRMNYNEGFLQLSGDDFEAWNEYVNTLRDSHSQQIVIKNPSTENKE